MNIVDEKRRTLWDEEESNCAGTALYLVGQRERDRPCHPWNVHPYVLAELRRLAEPELNCLVAWEKDEPVPNGKPLVKVFHMGVITSTDPLLITHRIGNSKSVHQDEPFDEVDFLYQHWVPDRVGFYKYPLPISA
ncbi:MAG: hypothetical protein ABIH92_03965 [Nanoarchaeota archaeon]